MVKLGKKAIFGIIAAAALAAGAIIVLLRPKHVEEILPVVGIDTVGHVMWKSTESFPVKFEPSNLSKSEPAWKATSKT